MKSARIVHYLASDDVRLHKDIYALQTKHKHCIGHQSETEMIDFLNKNTAVIYQKKLSMDA